jgi:hypothetical protein
MTILPQLERDLFDAAKQRLPAADTPDQTRDHPRRPEPRTTRRAGARRRLAATATTVPILLAVAVTVIVAAFALTLIHHGRQPPPAKPASSVQATRQQLIQMLSVLRRPQTKADLDPELSPLPRLASTPQRPGRQHQRPPAGLERFLARLGYPKLDRALVRVVKIPSWDAKVGIEPATWQPSPSSPRRVEGVDLSMWIGSKSTIPPSSEIGTGPRPTSVGTLRAHGLALTNNARGKHLMDGVLLVPDGVARITLRPIRVIGPPVKLDASQFGAVTATVHDNIAAFQLPIPTITKRPAISGMFGTSAVAQTTWFDANGQVLKQTTTNLPVLIKVIGNRCFPSRPGASPRRLRNQSSRPSLHAC